jgi:hypothetical protein
MEAFANAVDLRVPGFRRLWSMFSTARYSSYCHSVIRKGASIGSSRNFQSPEQLVVVCCALRWGYGTTGYCLRQSKQENESQGGIMAFDNCRESRLAGLSPYSFGV